MLAPALRYALPNVLGLIAITGLLGGGWYLAAATAVIVAVVGVADEAIGDAPALPGRDGALLYDTQLYLAAPILIIATAALMRLVAALAPVGSWPAGAEMAEAGVAVLLVGYFYALIGATVAHELVHRVRNRWAAVCASILLAFTFNTSFTVFHLRGHHRLAARWDDPATARRGETWLEFFVRTSFEQTAFAFRSETTRLRREGRNALTPRNRVLRRQAYSAAVLCGAYATAGLRGLLAFLAAALVGRIAHELINYVQHYGVIRAEGAPILPRHTWSSRRLLSNALHFNLPLHAEHHVDAARPFWRLGAITDGPVLPYGYQTMAVIALVPFWWRRVMAPHLDAWDRSFASANELALLRAYGRDGVY